VRRRERGVENSAYGRLTSAVDGLVTGLALERVQLRQPDGYSGRDRRSRGGRRQA
jgi:hypothetical protein